MKNPFQFRFLLIPLLAATLVACPPAPPSVGDVPATPTNFVVSSTTATSISLSWTLVSGATSYILERGVASGAKTQIATPSSTTNTYTDTGLTAGTSYGYALKAVNAKGSSTPALVAGIPTAGGSDTDSDGVSNADESAGWDVVISRGGTQLSTRKVTSDPSKADTDSDGLTDGQERSRFLDPNTDDTDADLLKDADEVNVWVSNPADVDTDNDSTSNSALFDGNELATYKTSPTLADTDGDFFTDFQEAITLGNEFKPLIANTPRFELEFASAPSISLNIVRTSDSQVVDTKSSSLALGTSSSKSSTDTNTERFSAEVSVTVGVEAKAGLDGGVTASSSVTATAGYGTENTKSFTSESGRSTQQTAESARTASSTQGQQIGGGTMTVGFKVKNTGDVAFTLTNLAISVLRRDPNDSTKYKFVGSMTPNLGSGTPPSLTLGKNVISGALGATLAFTDASELLEIMRNPADLRFELAGYDLKDGNDKNFAFQNDFTNGQTAQIVVDYGNGNVVRQRVATNVERVAGTIVGVKLGKALNDILGLPYTTIADTATGFKVMNGITDKKLGQIISSKTVADPKSLWVVIGSNGLNMTGNVDDILVKSGTEIRLMLARDVDGDNLLENEEYFYETSDANSDSDADTISDFDEVRTGWNVQVVGKPSKKVYANPKAVDSDADSLTDAQEKTAGTNPLLNDTDSDGTLDNLDTDPLNPATNPIITGFDVTLVGKTATVVANVANPSLKDSVINWGDGTNNTVLTGNLAKTINTQHIYATSGLFTVTLTASDSSSTPKTTMVSKVLDIKDITSNLLAWFKFNNNTNNFVGGTAGSIGGAGCVQSANGKDNLGDTAYNFNNASGAGCGLDQTGRISVPSLIFTQSFTFSVWIKPTGSLNSSWLMGQNASNGNNPWARLFLGTTNDLANSSTLIGTDSKVSMIVPLAGNTIVVTDPTAPALDQWVFYAATVSLNAGSTTVKLYRNGTEVASQSKNVTYNNPGANPFIIGWDKDSGNGGGSYFKGFIDSVRVYGRALAANEVIAVRDVPEN